jgi:hypothetical protein
LTTDVDGLRDREAGPCIQLELLSQFLTAFPLPPAVALASVAVARVIVTPLTAMSDVADTWVVPATPEVIATVQLAVALPPVYVQLRAATKLPGSPR